jgi:two-component system, chemotaxis family, sensor kinase CheA
LHFGYAIALIHASRDSADKVEVSKRSASGWDMPEHFEEEIREFLIESNENLANLDREIVELEQRPNDPELISSVFRTIHTIKGTCGFFSFDHLGAVAHITENILSQVREGQRRLTPELISLVLEAVDKIKALLLKIEADGNEGPDDSIELRARLETAYRTCGDEMCKQPAEEAAIEAVSEAANAVDSDMASEDRPAREAQLAESTIRVDVVLLDKLMNLVGELVLARNQLLQDATMQSAVLQQTSQRLNLITSELQEGVMKTRMQPIGVVWNKLPRVVRDLAAKCGKRVRIEMEGAGTELDKTIIEAIKDPLTHIVRNSCDHGIETPEMRAAKQKNAEGLLLLRAYHEGGVVNIEICDDGAGIDPEKLKKKASEKGLLRPEQAAAMSDRDARRLIFLPGLSTAQQVTSISGRGVGMDVVKTNIEKIGGSVEAISREPYGTIIRIKIPLTLAIIPGLIVSLDADANGAREQRFVVPQANLLELVRLEDKDDLKLIENLHGTPVFHHRGRLLPLVYLSRVLHHSTDLSLASSMVQGVNIVVLQAEGCQMGLVVDHIRDTQEIVVKPLGRQLKGLSCYVGATIMGDGRPALILDVTGLARLAGLAGQAGNGMQASLAESVFGQVQTKSQTEAQMMLLFRAGRFERLAVPLALVARLEEINARTIEYAAGRTVLNYCGEILPLVRLSAMLERSDRDLTMEGTVQVIVFADRDRHVGVMVDQIEDIVSEAIVMKRTSVVRGLLGSAILGGKITDLLDLDAVAEAAAESALPPTIDHAAAMLASYKSFQTEAVQ